MPLSITQAAPEITVPDAIRNLLENTTDMIYFKDLNSVFTLCSDSLTRHLTGGLEKSIVGLSDFDFFDHDCAFSYFEGEQQIIRTGTPILGKVESGVRDGINTWVFTSKLPLRDKAGKIIGTFGISRDITEQKLTEIELEKTNKQLVDASRQAGKAEVATNVIHNIGNVLTSLKVAISQSEELSSGMSIGRLNRVADLIDRHGSDANFFDEGQCGSHIPDYLRNLATSFESDNIHLKKELADIRRHLDHICAVVAQQQRHAIETKFVERVGLSELISDAVNIGGVSQQSHKIEIVRDFDEGLFVETDKHQVLQIVVNLIRNALHACLDCDSTAQRINISALNVEDDRFSISVADNGVGIAESNIAKLFTFGFTTREQGSGFGLHSCANTAKKLGGSLNVSSDGPGKGATFVLTLPGKLN